ncbi:MAG: ABC transporter substrate binding protein [Sulfuriferula sp.]
MLNSLCWNRKVTKPACGARSCRINDLSPKIGQVYLSSAISISHATTAWSWLMAYRLILLSVVSLFISTPSWAAGVLVLMSETNAPYQEVADTFRAELQQERPAVQVAIEPSLEHAESAISADTRLLISVGMRATRAALALNTRVPVLAVLVPKDSFDALVLSANEVRRPISAIYLDQPYSRQLALIRLAFPARRRVGVLLREQNRLKLEALLASAKSQKMQVNGELISNADEIVPSLEHLLASSDLLLILPDPLLYNKNDIQGVLLTSYHYHVPLIGYSEALVRAGAIMGLYSKPQQIGYQAAEVASRSLGTARLPVPQYPKYFTVSINQQVARSLNISVPDEMVLQQALQRWGQEQ